MALREGGEEHPYRLISDSVPNLYNMVTVIAVLHDINMAARYCDYLVALRGGEMIAQGTPAEIMRGETLEMIYGIPMGILPHPAGAAPVSFVY